MYDQLIVQTKAEIEATTSSPTSSSSSSKIVQPQIKIPKQQSSYEPPPSPTPSNSSFVQEAENTSQNSISLDESNSTDTIIASPQKPATPAAIEDEAPPIWPLAQSTEPPSEPETGTGNNNYYSDDFTSSSIASNVPDVTPIEEEIVTQACPRKAPKFSEKAVDSICGELLENLIHDAITQVKKAPKVKRIVEKPESGKPLSPTKRPQDLIMHTTFDISSESSEEGMYFRELNHYIFIQKRKFL